MGTVCLPLWALPVDSDAAEKILFYFDTTVTLPAGASGAGRSVRLGIPKPSKSTVNARLVAVSYAQVLGQEENFITVSEDNLGTVYADSLHLGDFTPASPTTLEELLGKSQQELEGYGYHPDTHKFDIGPMQAHPELFDITVNLPDNLTDQEQKYVVFAYWEVPSDKTFGGVTQYCCDHYSKLGTHAVTDYYDRYVEKYPELGQLFTQVGRCFFGDSLENNGNWTLEILKVYKELFHEDFTPYLYSIANGPWRVRPEMAPPPQEDVTGVVKGKPIDAPPRPPHYGLPFQMPDFSKGQLQYVSDGIEKLRKSYYEAMTHCFIENHVKEYSRWADKYDMDFRCQSTYGQKLYMMEASLNINTSITLRSSKPGRIPYLLNLWSGEIIPIPDYTHVSEDAVVVQLKLTGNDAMAIVLADAGWYDGPAPVLAGKPVEELPLENWSLRLLSHEPGPKALSGDDLTDTAIVPLELGLIGKPKPWTEISVLPDGRSGSTISGVGIYETDIFWDSHQTKRAVLDLGLISDLYRLTVNGTEVPGANPVYPVQDITRCLHDGENHICVEVASNFYHAEQSRNYLNTNYVEEKAYLRIGLTQLTTKYR